MKKKIFKSYIGYFLIAALISGLLTGCSGSELDLKSKKEKQTFDYEVPKSKPSVLVNQIGYHPDSAKKVLFVGENVPDEFMIIDMKTNESVFTGKIEHKGYRQDARAEVSEGDFTEFTREGEYYILCDEIGQSYHFSISDKIYDSLFTDLLKEISDHRWMNHHEETEELYAVSEENYIDISGGWYTSDKEGVKIRDVRDGAETMVNMLMSLEYYLEEQSDAAGLLESGNEIPDILDEVAYEAFWLLKMQDSKTGAVYSGVSESVNGIHLNESDMEACQYFIIAMAKFSYSMKNYDNKFATECLRASDAAWKYVESVRGSYKEEDKALKAQIDESLRFYGAAELFRASGAYRYHTVVKEYVPNTTDENVWTKEEYLGIYTYLSTRSYVSRSICEEWMKQVMDRGESIAGKSKKNSMLALALKVDEDCDNLLWNMMIMTSIDYIIANHEYDTILENNLHYILGRNANAYSYIEGYGNTEYAKEKDLCITKDVTQMSELIFVLSEIVSNQ